MVLFQCNLLHEATELQPMKATRFVLIHLSSVLSTSTRIAFNAHLGLFQGIQDCGYLRDKPIQSYSEINPTVLLHLCIYVVINSMCHLSVLQICDLVFCKHYYFSVKRPVSGHVSCERSLRSKDTQNELIHPHTWE